MVALRLGFGFVKLGVIYRFLLAMLEQIYGFVYLVLAHFSHPFLGTYEVHQFLDLGYLEGTHSGGGI